MAFAKDYVDVATRIRDFKTAYPDGSLQQVRLEFHKVGDQEFILYVAACFRYPDDPRPGIGSAWEPVPGKTPYTKDSEVMNAESSAWGRAIIAATGAETKIATLEDVRNRQVTPQPSKKDWLAEANEISFNGDLEALRALYEAAVKDGANLSTLEAIAKLAETKKAPSA
jgi:hypothetical protein